MPGIESSQPPSSPRARKALTLSGSLGLGGQLSVGTQDANHDGKKELCAKLGGVFGSGVTVGVCIENPF